MNGVDPTVGFDHAYAAEQLRRARHPLRRTIKRFYLDNTLREVDGPTIDFGCGAGQLLRRLPPGSVGLEINPALIGALTAEGLDVRPYDAATDDFALALLPAGKYRNLVMSHVLEHFADAQTVLHKLLAGCRRLGVQRAVFIVPGAKGYASDPTHCTFVTRDWLATRGLARCEGYRLATQRYFPLNVEVAGRYLVFHELLFVYLREDSR